jgi:hypothetical protein
LKTLNELAMKRVLIILGFIGVVALIIIGSTVLGPSPSVSRFSEIQLGMKTDDVYKTVGYPSVFGGPGPYDNLYFLHKGLLITRVVDIEIDRGSTLSIAGNGHEFFPIDKVIAVHWRAVSCFTRDAAIAQFSKSMPDNKIR